METFIRDTKKMVEDIDRLVNTDFGSDMETKACLPDLEGKPRVFTQEEASQMAKVISSVYLISHGLHCDACGAKYRIVQPIQPFLGRCTICGVPVRDKRQLEMHIEMKHKFSNKENADR